MNSIAARIRADTYGALAIRGNGPSRGDLGTGLIDAFGPECGAAGAQPFKALRSRAAGIVLFLA